MNAVGDAGIVPRASEEGGREDRLPGRPHDVAHARHVADLALKLFDALHTPLGIPASERHILRQAAELHDIGAAAAPRDTPHAVTSANLVLREGLRHAPLAERRLVAAVILLHRLGAEDEPGGRLLRTLEAPRRAYRLAAVLRIADGLDHGHVQDVSLRDVAIVDGELHVGVRCRAYRGNVLCAQRKSGLFTREFGLPVRIEAKYGKTPAVALRGLIAADCPVAEAARRLAAFHLRVLRDSVGPAGVSDDPEFLHDLRVSARRCRSVFRVFRRHFPREWSDRARAHLTAISRRAGPARDRQVWCAMLRELNRDGCWDADPAWWAYVAAVDDAERRSRRELAEYLDSDECHASLRWLTRRICTDWKAVAPASADVSFGDEVRRIDVAISRRVRKLPRDISRMTAAEVHAVRKSCRRARYAAELAAALEGSSLRRVRQLSGLTQSLGTVHDIDVRGGGGSGEEVVLALPDKLERALRKRRRALVREYARAWK